MKRVLIIGGGFAGLSAAAQLSRHKQETEVTLVDRNPYLNFLPALPDTLGRGLDPDFLIFPLNILSKRFGFNFLQTEARAIDLEKHTVSTPLKDFTYDYLLIASGSETNFYGNAQVSQNAYKLDDVKDARRLKDSLDRNDFEHFVIAGGGYTGIEIAVNLRVYLNKRTKDRPIIIVEKAQQILGPLPTWIKDYVADNLNKLDIRVLTNNSIAGLENNRVTLSTGDAFDNAVLIWAAGVKIPDAVQKIEVPKTAQGRIKVDPYLRLGDNCFAAGDASYFESERGPLRMAVQFAITQGRHAALNIIRDIRKEELRKYAPVDLGYIIPLANNRSCGQVLGLRMKGWLPTFFHYVMCAYRSYGLKNKYGVIRDFIRPRT